VETGKLSFTFQDPNTHVIGGTVRESLVPYVHDEVICRLALQQYLERDILEVPLWVRQATVLLNALLSSNDIIVLDEPIDGISYKVFGDAAVELINEKANSGALVFVVTHNPRLARRISTDFVWVSNNVLEYDHRQPASHEREMSLLNWLCH